LRWKEDLSQFSDLKVDIINDNEWSFNHHNVPHVFLCDYRTFLKWIKTNDYQAAEQTSFLNVDYALLCVDLRYHVCTSEEISNHQLYESEIYEWWVALTEFFGVHSQSRRLFVEHLHPMGPISQVSRGSKCGIGGNANLEKVLALKVACCYPLLFPEMRGASTGKRLVSWIKSERMNLYGILNLDPTNVDIRCILKELALCVRFVIDSDGLDETINWELRASTLISEPNIKHDPCTPMDSNKSFHGEDEVKIRQWQGTHSLFGAMLEPNIEEAKKLMNNSAKMKELLLLLTNECGLVIDNEWVLLQKSPGSCNVSSLNRAAAKKRQKVLILASLAKTRIRISHFLSLVGIRNQALDAISGTVCAADAWGGIQIALSMFNRKEDSGIIISSPEILSSLNGGICPTSVDYVISVDEEAQDGHNAIHYTSLAKKISCHQRNATVLFRCKFIKIVTREDGVSTMSATFINGSTSSSATSPITKQHFWNISSLPVDSVAKTSFVRGQQALHSYGLTVSSLPVPRLDTPNHTHPSECLSPPESPDFATGQSFGWIITRQSVSRLRDHISSTEARKNASEQKQTTSSKKINTVCASDVISLLTYNPIATRIDQVREIDEDTHSGNEVLITKAVDGSRGFQPLVYLPPNIRPTAHHGMFPIERKSQSTTSSNGSQKQHGVMLDENLTRKLITNSNSSFCCFGEKVSKSDELDLYQQWPAAHSIILIAEKLQMQGMCPNVGQSSLSTSLNASTDVARNSSQNNSFVPKVLNLDEQKPMNFKKIRKHQTNTVPGELAHGKNEMSIRKYHGDLPSAHLARSLVLSVKLRFLVGDIVSDQFFRSRNATAMQSLLVGGKNEFAAFSYGLRAKKSISNLARRERNLGGIVLPMGLKMKKRLARKLATSYKEAIEPWIDKEERLLQEYVALYGMNWQLVAKGVSAASFCLYPRSPQQCQIHWEHVMKNHSDSVSNVPTSDVLSHRLKAMEQNLLGSKNTKQQQNCQDEEHWIQNSHSILRQYENSTDARELVTSLKLTSKKMDSTSASTSTTVSTMVERDSSIRLVPVHVSHRETVQAASANAVPLKSDMWPMELMDYTEKIAASSNCKRRERLLSSTQSYPIVKHHRSSYNNGAYNISHNNMRHAVSSQGAHNIDMSHQQRTS
jgi:hypothetical protein